MKNKTITNLLIVVLLFFIAACGGRNGDATATHTQVAASEESKQVDSWQLGPFVKVDSVNPVMLPQATSEFKAPILNVMVKWEEKDVFNPSAVVKDDKVHLLYRAEDKIGKHAGTSRIGLAIADDGLHFTRNPEPVFGPGEDEYKKYEWDGGTEDPRIVQDENGVYYMTYSAWAGKNSFLSIATSDDLHTWVKHGPVFEDAYQGKYLNTWSKSGAIVSKLVDGKMIAQKINGKYWMYWGDTDVFLATSDNLLDWVPMESKPADELKASRPQFADLKPVFGPRRNKFDSDLVEPGPAPMITDKGILLIYNGRNAGAYMDKNLPEGTYSGGQILLDLNDPTKVLARSEDYFITPDADYEITGQVGRVCFVEGLVHHKNKWYLYYGTADSKIAVAVCDAPGF